jgi:hypothetical protein
MTLPDLPESVPGYDWAWAAVLVPQTAPEPPDPVDPPEPEPAPEPEALIDDSFAGPDAVLAQEPDDSPNGLWNMNSGTLYRKDDAGWTGEPDSRNGSAIFRMNSTVDELPPEIDVTLDLRIDKLVETNATPEVDWDGAHVWVRYLAEDELYAVTVARRDGSMVIKKKVPGGPSNGGTYHELGSKKNVPIPFGQWMEVSVEVRDLANGDVEITLHRDEHTLRVLDGGVGGARPLHSGRMGVRGDNADMRFKNILVVQA